MLLIELLTEAIDFASIVTGAGWLNLNDHRWVTVGGDWCSHASEVALRPEKFDLDPDALLASGGLPPILTEFWSRPNWRDYRCTHNAVTRMDGDQSILEFMGGLGWTRIIHDAAEETNIQGNSMREIRKAANYLYDNAYGITELHITIGPDDATLWFPVLRGEQLMRFLAGKFTPQPTMVPA